MQTCPSCGEKGADRFLVCGMCGAQLGAVVVAEEVRKTVTVVYSDLKGFTPLAERLDAETLPEVFNHYSTRWAPCCP